MFLALSSKHKVGTPDCDEARREAGKLYAQLGGGPRAAYVTTAAYAWFCNRDTHDRSLQPACQAAYESCEEHLRDPSKPWEMPGSGVLHDFAKNVRTHRSTENAPWLKF